MANRNYYNMELVTLLVDNKFKIEQARFHFADISGTQIDASRNSGNLLIGLKILDNTMIVKIININTNKILSVNVLHIKGMNQLSTYLNHFNNKGLK